MNLYKHRRIPVSQLSLGDHPLYSLLDKGQHKRIPQHGASPGWHILVVTSGLFSSIKQLVRKARVGLRSSSFSPECVEGVYDTYLYFTLREG
jgi:hypothetical protein